LPGGFFQVAIVNVETSKACSSRKIGEIWVASAFNRLGYTGLAPDLQAQVSVFSFFLSFLKA
jgi:hypothetical protein